jgi:hypothetical protein
MAPKYCFNGIGFSSLLTIDKYIRNIKNKLISDGIVKICPESEYYPFFDEILENHYDRVSKIGDGVLYYYFVKGHYNEDQLRIMRADGTDIDCSYMYSKIIKPASYDNSLNSALRHSIYSQIQNYRKTLVFPVSCNHCADELGYYEIDHVLPFDTLKKEFIKLNPPPNSFYDDVNNTCHNIFKADDHEYRDKWNEYHLTHASYQVLCKLCNGRKSNR